MTALNKDRNTARREGDIVVDPVLAAKKIFGGSIVAVDANGYAQPAADTAGLKVRGVAEEQADNSAGASGAKTIRVRRGVFKFAATGLTIADVGKPVFVSDDQTVSVAATTNNVCAGIMVDIDSATEAWVAVGYIGERAAAAQADSVAADVATLKTDFNALLAKLRGAKLMAS